MIKSRAALPRGRRLRLLAAAIPLAALLATACSPAQTGAASSARPARQPTPPPPTSTADCNSVTTCYTPQQLQVAYGITPLLDRGINGSGETVVLPELAESQLNPPDVTDMRQDMAAFDNMFRLPAARMRVITTLAGAGSPWLAFGEEVLDVEMVHALAPGAALVILLLPSTSLDNTHNAVSAAVASLRLGSTEGGVMSISAAGQVGGEHCVSRAQADSVNAALQAAASRHATVLAASGDIAPMRYPRDVYSAAVSARAPSWAGLIGLADQYARRPPGFVNAVIYQIARGPPYHRAFHDIALGNNTVQFPPTTSTGYQAAPGWDPVTGWGGPDAQVL